MDELQEQRAKKEAGQFIKELETIITEAFSGDAVVIEYEDLAILKNTSGIISVVAFNTEKRYEFMSPGSAAEFIVMNAEHFVDLGDSEDEE